MICKLFMHRFDVNDKKNIFLPFRIRIIPYAIENCGRQLEDESLCK
jgi:hypothetical protein